MIQLFYEPMKFSDGDIARYNCLAIGRVWRQSGDQTWTVGFGGMEVRSEGYATKDDAKAALMRLCQTDEPWPARPTFRP